MDVTVDGKRAHAATGSRERRAGEGAVIFVHGAGMDRTAWQFQTRNVANMGRLALAVDLPGHGRSEGPPLGTIVDLAEWVVRFMDAAEIPSAKLVGHSMGALTVLETAARHPDRVEALCLMGVADTMPVHPDLLAAAERNEALGPELIVFWGFGDRAQIGGHALPGFWVSGAGHVLLDRAADGVLYHGLAACNAYNGGAEAAARVTCPTLFVLGAGDRMTPPKKGRALAGLIEGSRTAIIEDAGHMMMAENPDAVFEAIHEFV